MCQFFCFEFEYSIVCIEYNLLSIHLLMDIYAFSTFWLMCTYIYYSTLIFMVSLSGVSVTHYQL